MSSGGAGVVALLLTFFLISILIGFVRFVGGRCAKRGPLVVLSLSSASILTWGWGRAIDMRIWEAFSASVDGDGWVWGGSVVV